MVVTLIDIIKMIRGVMDIGLADAKNIADAYVDMFGGERRLALENNADLMQLVKYIGAINKGTLTIETGEHAGVYPAKPKSLTAEELKTLLR